MCIQDVIQAVGSVGTFLAAVAAIVTVFLVRRQIRVSYMPNLCVLGQPFTLFERSNLLFLSAHEDFDTTSPQDLALSVSLVNVGLGAAQGLQLTWSTDFGQYISGIAAVDQARKWNIQMTGPDELTITEGQLPASYSLPTLLHSGLSFAVPISIAGAPDVVTIPGVLLDLVTVYFRAHIFQTTQPSVNPAELSAPPISLQVSYRDIGGKRCTKEFQLVFSTNLYSSTAGPLGPNVHARGWVRIA